MDVQAVRKVIAIVHLGVRNACMEFGLGCTLTVGVYDGMFALDRVALLGLPGVYRSLWMLKNKCFRASK